MNARRHAIARAPRATHAPARGFSLIIAMLMLAVIGLASAATLGAWIDCGNSQRTATDGYLRRTFTTTIVLQNKLL